MNDRQRRLALIRLRHEIQQAREMVEPIPELVLRDEVEEESEPLDLCDMLELLGVS